MGNLIDLRKHNIKTVEDAMEFLELFVTKAPQIANVLKDQKFKIISMKNRIDQAKAAPQAGAVANPEASVLDQLTGNNLMATPTPEQARIAQLRAAQSNPAPAAPAGGQPAGSQETDDLPPAPVAPGEIGQLNIPGANQTAPAATTAPELPDASGHLDDNPPAPATNNAPVPDDGPAGATNGADPAQTEGDAVLAAGPKSVDDDGLQPQDATDEDDEGEELSDEDKALLEVPSTVPPEADKTSIGSKIAGAVKNLVGGNEE